LLKYSLVIDYDNTVIDYKTVRKSVIDYQMLKSITTHPYSYKFRFQNLKSETSHSSREPSFPIRISAINYSLQRTRPHQSWHWTPLLQLLQYFTWQTRRMLRLGIPRICLRTFKFLMILLFGTYHNYYISVHCFSDFGWCLYILVFFVNS